jgi:hypothetical protein
MTQAIPYLSYNFARYLNLTFTEISQIYCLKIRTTLAYLIRNNTIKDLFYVVNSFIQGVPELARQLLTVNF